MAGVPNRPPWGGNWAKEFLVLPRLRGHSLYVIAAPIKTYHGDGSCYVDAGAVQFKMQLWAQPYSE
jgi:hypothetical protein